MDGIHYTTKYNGIVSEYPSNESRNQALTSSGEFDHARRFGGIARLYGEAALQRLAQAHVCVVGIGGVGSWAVEALARSAVGELTLIDLDNIAESNVNRQIHALDPEFGRAKVEAMAARVRAINPSCRVHPLEQFVEVESLEQLIHSGYDYLLDCIDSYRIKAALIARCRRLKLPLVTVGGAGGQRDPLKITLGDLSRTEQDPLLSKTRKLLRQEYGFSRNPKRRFAVPCVYSREQPCAPLVEAAACDSGTAVTGLNCAGYGSAMTVTASFALVAVAHLLERLGGQQRQGER